MAESEKTDSKNTQKEMFECSEIKDLDSLLLHMGGFGRYQFWTLVALISIVSLCTFSELGFTLFAAKLKHRCFISECETLNNTDYSLKNKPWLPYSIPKESNHTEEYDSCLRYNNPQCSNNESLGDPFQCDKFVYETEEWTMHREDWGPHCKAQQHWLTIIGCLNNVGQVLGGIFAGYAQDRFGRKTTLVTLTIIVVFLGTIKSFSVNYTMALVLEIIEAGFAMGMFNGPFVLALEIVDPSKRVLAGCLLSMAYPSGTALLGVVQYLTLHWRNTIRFAYLPFSLSVLYYWKMPESVRWLLDKKRNDEASRVLKTIARINGKNLPDETIQNVVLNESLKSEQTLSKDSEHVNTLGNLFRSKKMRYRIFSCCIMRICSIFVYFALTMNSVNISDDKFLNFILSGLIEIPGYLVALILMDRLGRKVTFFVLSIVCSISCITAAFLPPSLEKLQLTVFFIGKLGASGCVYGTDIYTSEMFPTFARSTILTWTLLLGKLFTVGAPALQILKEVYTPLPLLICGVMAAIAACGVIIFPETLNTILPHTIEEAETLGTVKKENRNQIRDPS